MAGFEALGYALEDDAAAAAAALGPQVDDPVRLGDHIEVVLDHQHRVAGVDQAVQHADQLLDIGHVQADRRLVEHIERLQGIGLGKLIDQLDALRFASRERRALLADRKSTRLNSSHSQTSYAVFCLKKKNRI